MAAHLILRELIEDTASALHADLRHRDLPHEERVNKLRQKYFCQLLGELKEVVGEELVNEVKEVWNETSSRIHATATKKGDGLLSKAVKHIEEHGAPPSYLAAPLPTTYELPESDIEELKELTKTIHKTKKVIDKLLKTWHSKIKEQRNQPQTPNTSPQ